jgi:hypothetical protein
MKIKPQTDDVPRPPPRTGDAISPGQFRVVVDSMLQGLGRQLRNCGVDVDVLENDADHAKTIEVRGTTLTVGSMSTY